MNILQQLHPLSPEERNRLLDAISAYFGRLEPNQIAPRSMYVPAPSRTNSVPFSVVRDISLRDFLLQKKPRTGVERVVCMAYYLLRHRNQQSFTNSDLLKMNSGVLNAGASLPRRVSDAVKAGLLIQVTATEKKLTAKGEALALSMPKRLSKELTSTGGSTSNGDQQPFELRAAGSTVRVRKA